MKATEHFFRTAVLIVLVLDKILKCNFERKLLSRLWCGWNLLKLPCMSKCRTSSSCIQGPTVRLSSPSVELLFLRRRDIPNHTTVRKVVVRDKSYQDI